MRAKTGFAGKSTTRTKAMVIFFAIAGAVTIARADPLSRYDEFLMSTLTLDKCHVKPPSGEPDEIKVRWVGDAAWYKLWDMLDEQDEAHHDENARKADAELKKRSEADLARVKELMATKGCDALVPHALEVAKKYLQ